MVGLRTQPRRALTTVFHAPSWSPLWIPTSRWTLVTAYMRSCRTRVSMLKLETALTTRAGAGQVGDAAPESRERLSDDQGGRMVTICPLS